MNRKSIGIVIALVAVIAIAGVVFATNHKSASKTASNSATTQSDVADSSMDMPSGSQNGTGGTPAEDTTTPDTGASSSPTQPTQSTKVSIQDFAFAPASLTVKKGTKVVWTNSDSAVHTVTVDSGTGPKSGSIEQGGTFSYTFDTVGSFAYHCDPHPFMKATVTVTE